MRPLEDIRIIAVEQYGAGPFGSVHLADLGADVIKIEEPATGGDVGRYVPPYAQDEDSLFFETFNRGKRSVSLDLATAAGREVFEDLVRHADAVYSNLRGDVPAKIGITYDQLKHINPSIVCCSLTGFGMTGPRAKQPGYDYILQGLAGWMDLTGEPGGPPAKSGLSIVDYSGGFVAAISLLAGVHAARRDGRGMDCDLSLFDTAIGMLTYPAAWHLNAGFTPERTRYSAHPSLVPFQLFPSADGWVVVGCAKEKFWQRLVTVLDVGILREPRFATFADRREHAAELLPLLEGIFATRDTADWLAVLEPAGIPCGPVNDVAAALRDPHTLARGLVVETEHPRYGTVKQVASPVRVGDQPPAYRRAPRRGEDLGYVSELLDYSPEQLEKLRAAGAFGKVAE
ncbi:crotonobetainyl-CoA:carnitine CoA-transferase CaiB-like acyl-CoA transferase [Actinoplanes lutulentus]|uniref:Crotonobetainyl-CoA:carnitine CoA-transferase CaiB-like acyl-CoA transferase n=1 Tax=Actinoplanes lutulentus TaxID=1287878 RepID=A0A327ZJE0_9ACTN|nr:CoA transferase [Actinoplanes lutulentus]MBB2944387.1 crotonobetainyl-CoA:carnitine CoA-transferase CaiB-like acyl-CoA transferase [Actinoplanes lutulentus]RAK42381.1 crotonobetainyl-CoA:carnitine CoA-transferase CaiB-like acyl-CoA transferase [Actinoplanes lutulentus]